MLSYKWLSRYGLLKNFEEKIHFEDVLEWKVGSNDKESKPAQQGIYGQSLTALCWVVVKIRTSKKYSTPKYEILKMN